MENYKNIDIILYRTVSTLTKTNNFFFQKINSFIKFEIIEFSIIYYDIGIWVVKLFRVYVAYDSYDDFQHVNFLFSQILVSLFWRLFNYKSDLSVR